MKKGGKSILAVFVLLCLALAACGGGGGGDEKESAQGSGEAAAGDAARGEELFKQSTIGASAAPGCATCHSLEPGLTLVGPSLADTGERAGSQVEGQSAEEYLRRSIVAPDEHVMEGFPAGVMYQKYGEDLSEQEIDDLVAYLLTLK